MSHSRNDYVKSMVFFSESAESLGTCFSYLTDGSPFASEPRAYFKVKIALDRVAGAPGSAVLYQWFTVDNGKFNPAGVVLFLSPLKGGGGRGWVAESPRFTLPAASRLSLEGKTNNFYRTLSATGLLRAALVLQRLPLSSLLLSRGIRTSTRSATSCTDKILPCPKFTVASSYSLSYREFPISGLENPKRQS